MKTLLTKSKYAFVALSFLIFASCSSDDVVSSPSVTYSDTTLDATFFQEGNSLAPTLSWNGSQGSFSLATPIAGLSINTTTGVLNWTKDLPIGTHNLQVIASNSAGQTTINLTINNPLQGVFTGLYDSSSFFEIEFNADGTLILRANDETSPDIATGTWSKTDSKINADYTYDTGGEFSLSGTISTSSSALYAGDWFFNHGSLNTNKGGSFEVILN